ncbi:MAG: hypothetical protein E6G41_05480 [Actinobacteria bacterium]|nr:MAG: hypothetical protein E6G41_05480 [Actinomycetota bacterium]
MATTESTPRVAGAREAGPGVVVLFDTRSGTERELIERWAQRVHPGADLIAHDEALLAERLARGDDPLIVPARVTWLPSARDSTSMLGDLRALVGRQPAPFLQRLVLARAPGRAIVSPGEPARAGELAQQFEIETGGVGDFVAFVSRRATLAVDRAERPLIGDRYKVPRLVAEQVAASARVRERAAAVAAKLGRDPDDVLAELTADLQEIAAVQSPPAIDTFRAVMGPLHRRAWTVKADTAELEALRELNRTTALVFLPSHRSYSDPLVLADVLDAADFPRNHVLAGGNMSFWPIGPLGKRAGLIFIRRSFGGDQVYKLAIREYFGHLVAKRFNLEWYIEGGRSRTGKLRPPRYGLLHYLVRALEDGNGADVTLIPGRRDGGRAGRRREVGRGHRLARRIPARAAAQRRRGARALRRAALAAPGAGGRGRRQRAAREGRVPDHGRHQPRDAGDRELARHVRAAERARPRAHARAGARGDRAAARPPRRPRHPGACGRPARRLGGERHAGGARRQRRCERVRRRRRARVVDRARPRARRGLHGAGHARPRHDAARRRRRRRGVAQGARAA